MSVFELTTEEKAEVVANCDQFEPLKHSSALPRAFKEPFWHFKMG